MKKLTDLQHHITQEKGTEPSFSGKYNNHKEKGVYLCVCCNNQLFSSDNKYDSGSGWPSFDAPVDSSNIGKKLDTSHKMERTEVKCSKCGAHLGHVFDDGPQETTGKRYCINSASLDFKKND
jgi:peptide-methionine (R)-S-oxide reductase